MAGKQEDVDDDNMPLGSLATLHKDSRKPANKQPGSQAADQEPTQATDAGGSGSTVGRPRRATRSASLKSPADGPTSEPRVTRAKAGRGRGGKSDLLRSASEAGDSDADPNTPRGGVSGPAAAALARKNSRNRGAAKGQAQAQGQERDPDAQDEVKREASAPEGQAGPVEESQETPAAQGSKRRPRRGSDAGKAGSKAEAEALPEGSSRDASAEPAVPAGRTAAHPATTPIDRLRAHSAALQGEAGATAGSQENALSADAGDGDGAAAAEDPLPDAEPDTQGKKGTKRQLSRRHSSRAVHKPATYSPSRETKPKSEPRPRRGKPAVADEAAAGEPEAEAEVKDGQMPDAGKAEPPAADAAEDLHVNEAQEKEASGPDAGTHPGDPRDAYEPEAGDEHESPVRLKPGQSITRKRANKRKKDDEPVGYDEAQELSASAKKHKAKKRSKEPAPEQPAFEPDEDYLDDPENLRQAKKKRDAIHRLEASYREAQEAATKLADQVDALLEQCGDVEVTLDILKDTGLGRDIARVAKQRQQVSEHLAERGAKARSLVDKWRSLTLGGGKPSKAKSASAEPKAASAAQPSTTEPPSGPAADDARPTAGAAGTAVEDQAAVRPASKAAAAATARLTSGDLHSLGDDTRDKGVSILTYALTPPLALTPEEAAKQLEAALFDKYAENGAADVLYRRRLHALWSYLSPESCHVIAELRSELLEDMAVD
ncbi:hypothetical protein WJX72_007064 [[Myrmecia] bisecta]|uniref:TFIIS N-terminal domain-containing protein n=1 Tax=[Myrmecia] bisecta TaxID=41462 RepID=A0AAW1Q3B6_9CHLO